MKKLLVLLLTLAMTFSLVACGDKAENKPNEETKPPVQSENTTQQPENTPVDEVDEPQTEEPGEQEPGEQEPGEQLPDAEVTPADIRIEDIVVYNENNITISATGLNLSRVDDEGLEVYLIIKNDNSEDIEIKSSNILVNGFITENTYKETVKGKDEIHSKFFVGSEFIQNYNLKCLEEFRFNLSIFKKGTDEAIADKIKIAIPTNQYGLHNHLYDDSGILVMDTEGIVVKIRSITDSINDGVNIQVYMENNSDKDVNIRFRDVMVDDGAVNIQGNFDMLNGSKISSKIRIFEDIAVKDVKDISFSVDITNNYDGKSIASLNGAKIKVN